MPLPTGGGGSSQYNDLWGMCLKNLAKIYTFCLSFPAQVRILKMLLPGHVRFVTEIKKINFP